MADLSLLDEIEALNLGNKLDILRAIAIKNSGHKHLELYDTEIATIGQEALGEDIVPVLPNSRMLVMFQLDWPVTEPNLQWIKKRSGSTATGIVLSSLDGAKKKLSDFQFDEPVTRGTSYNLTADQVCTLDYLLVVEYVIGL